MVNRVVVGAHYGLRDWLLQRVTAVLMVIYTLLLVCFLLTMPKDYVQWQAWFGLFWVKLFTQVTLVALFLHAWVGVRDIWMDYIKPSGLRLFLHVCTILWLVSCFIYSITVVWGL